MNQIAALNINIRIDLIWAHDVKINWNSNFQKCYFYCKFLTYRFFFLSSAHSPSGRMSSSLFFLIVDTQFAEPLTVWKSKFGGSFWNYLTPQIFEEMASSSCNQKHGYMYYLPPCLFSQNMDFLLRRGRGVPERHKRGGYEESQGFETIRSAPLRLTALL